MKRTVLTGILISILIAAIASPSYASELSGAETVTIDIAPTEIAPEETLVTENPDVEGEGAENSDVTSPSDPVTYQFDCGEITLEGGVNCIHYSYDFSGLEDRAGFAFALIPEESLDGNNSRDYTVVKKMEPFGEGALCGSGTVTELHPATSYRFRLRAYSDQTSYSNIETIDCAITTRQENSYQIYNTVTGAVRAAQAHLLALRNDPLYFYVKLDPEKLSRDRYYMMDTLQAAIESKNYNADSKYLQADLFTYYVFKKSIHVFDGDYYELFEVTLDMTSEDISDYKIIKKWANKTISKCRGKTTKKKYMILNQYVMASCSYDYTEYRYYAKHRKKLHPWAYGMRGVVIHKKAVCSGYANAYQFLCRLNGLPCEKVKSTTHAWNLVKYGKKWYHVDTCWNDCRKKSKHIFLKRQSKTIKLSAHKLLAAYKTKAWRAAHPTN